MMDITSDLVGLIPAVVCGIVVGIVAHEAGHWAFAALASLPVKKVQIGVGPVLYRGRFGKVELELRALPIGGQVQLLAFSDKTPRGRFAFLLLGGIVANAALLGLALAPGAVDMPFALPDPACAGFAIAQLSLLGAAAVPLWGRRGGVRFPNDAMQVVLLLRGRHHLDAYRSYDQLLAYYADGKPTQMTDASCIFREQMARPGLLTDARVRRDVFDSAQRELAKDAMSREERRLIVNLLVTMAVLSRDPSFYPHLDEWSRQEAELAGEAPSNTRGIALVELGEFAAGKALLDAIAKPDYATADPFDMSSRIATQAFIARAEGALGARVAARGRLDKARRAISANMVYEVLRPLINRIDRELIAGRYASPATAANGRTGRPA